MNLLRFIAAGAVLATLTAPVAAIPAAPATPGLSHSGPILQEVYYRRGYGGDPPPRPPRR